MYLQNVMVFASIQVRYDGVTNVFLDQRYVINLCSAYSGKMLIYEIYKNLQKKKKAKKKKIIN